MTAEAYRIAGARRADAAAAAGRDSEPHLAAARGEARTGAETTKGGRPFGRPPSVPSCAAGRQTSSMNACSLPSPGRGPSLMMRV